MFQNHRNILRRHLFQNRGHIQHSTSRLNSADRKAHFGMHPLNDKILNVKIHRERSESLNHVFRRLESSERIYRVEADAHIIALQSSNQICQIDAPMSFIVLQAQNDPAFGELREYLA